MPVVRRGELTDEAWAVIAPLRPQPGGARERWRDHRQVINGILWKLRTGAPWRDLPERFGPWKTCHERLRRWTADGTWTGSWRRRRCMTTAFRCSGRSASTRRSCGRTSMPLAPAKRGLRIKSGDAWCARWRGHRTIPRRAEHEDPPRRRRTRPAAVDPAHLASMITQDPR
ncbi:hypothetical protein Strop_2661 [Salinispora tropica CNB-440]|uniref:Insertion element IS402-like domain-containing protein n=1 Tax=Salinispora tropica (strain ATCC BAA-916 / DSM 44818 / JCM 13857 / NBRC 105044 / CNB-440) TaxID=369723 RepID=A4X8A5_SALTO|nr:hypothetical protein Strop_2661 [Salinispora tropica CNB-440]